jgi:hypothetical protein
VLEVLNSSYLWLLIDVNGQYQWGLPSGKRLHFYGKSPFLMGKSTISMAIVNSYVSSQGKWAFNCGVPTVIGGSTN